MKKPTTAELIARLERLPTKAELIAACESLAKKGLIIDTGKRRLDPQTGEMDIVWVAVPATEVEPGVYVKKGWQ